MAPRVDTDYRNEIAKAREDLRNLISKEKYSASDLLRLAYASQFSIDNSAAITDATTKTTQSANNNLKTPIENIKAKHSTITYPDLYQLAGVVAVEALGGPKIKFFPGREGSSISPDEDWLPYGKHSPSDLKEAFRRVGISDSKHIVALCGGLELVRRADSERSGVPGVTLKSGVQEETLKSGVQGETSKSGVQGETSKSGVQGETSKSGVQRETLEFDNSYFVELVKKKDLTPIDKALLYDPDFRDSVLRYSENKEAFLRDYEESHKKLSEHGLTTLKNKLVNMPVAQRAVGVAVAAAVVILSVFYLINRRRAKHSSQQFQ